MASNGTRRGWIGYDLDGTIAEDEPGQPFDINHVGKPIPKMIAQMKRDIEEDIYDVKIFTARVHNEFSPYLDARLEAIRAKQVIQKWIVKQVGKVLDVTSQKDYLMVRLYDDRAYRVIRNTGEVCCEHVPGVALGGDAVTVAGYGRGKL